MFSVLGFTGLYCNCLRQRFAEVYSMAKVSISKAAELAGISRTALYKTYINKGLISVSKNDKDKKSIDTAEIIRVFGGLKVNNERLTTVNPENSVNPVKVTTQTQQDFEVKQLRMQLEESRKREQEAREREGWYKKQIDALTDTMKLLEGPVKKNRPWWEFWK